MPLYKIPRKWVKSWNSRMNKVDIKGKNYWIFIHQKNPFRMIEFSRLCLILFRNVIQIINKGILKCLTSIKEIYLYQALILKALFHKIKDFEITFHNKRHRSYCWRHVNSFVCEKAFLSDRHEKLMVSFIPVWALF